jgi:hypothetical protein
MPQNTVDPRKVVAGDSGRLFVGWTDPNGNSVSNRFLAQVTNWHAQANYATEEKQFGGSRLKVKVPVGESYSLTLNETLVTDHDGDMFGGLFNYIKNGNSPIFKFRGEVYRPGTLEVIEVLTFDYCVPDGSVDLMKVQPGQVIDRDWTFAVNEWPY